MSERDVPQNFPHPPVDSDKAQVESVGPIEDWENQRTSMATPDGSTVTWNRDSLAYNDAQEQNPSTVRVVVQNPDGTQQIAASLSERGPETIQTMQPEQGPRPGDVDLPRGEPVKITVESGTGMQPATAEIVSSEPLTSTPPVDGGTIHIQSEGRMNPDNNQTSPQPGDFISGTTNKD